ncbi:MAG: LysR family transcriptional regulator [Nitrospirae bacterium GWC2_42_7]|nr:MAG: LysR family transcriptional regulator [Nitrospirae bacterium GWC2_42_7]
MTPEEKLKSLDIELQEMPKPLGSYLPFVRTGNLLYLSGMLPLRDGKLIKEGRVGENVTPDDAVQLARAAAINALAVLRYAVGSLNNVKRCVKITGFISSAQDFTGQPKVLNGASDLIFDIFDEAGRHARAAVGVNVLPMNSPIEIEFIFEVE